MAATIEETKAISQASYFEATESAKSSLTSYQGPECSDTYHCNGYGCQGEWIPNDIPQTDLVDAASPPSAIRIHHVLVLAKGRRMKGAV